MLLASARFSWGSSCERAQPSSFFLFVKELIDLEPKFRTDAVTWDGHTGVFLCGLSELIFCHTHLLATGRSYLFWGSFFHFFYSFLLTPICLADVSFYLTQVLECSRCARHCVGISEIKENTPLTHHFPSNGPRAAMNRSPASQALSA